MSRPLAALAFLWGFAEATLFVIVPDVLVSAVAVRHGLRPALFAGCLAAVGAALGGFAVVAWGAADPRGAGAAMALLPGIDAALVEDASRRFAADGLLAVLGGAFSGIPYKLFALAAGEAGRDPVLFAAVTPLIRLPRFVATALLAAACARMLAPFAPMRTRLLVLAVFWLVFYAAYFSLMPA